MRSIEAPSSLMRAFRGAIAGRVLCLTLSLTAIPSLVQAAELVMFERADCPVCLRWDREIAPIYPKTAESRAAPLRRVTLDAATGIQLTEPVRYTPTFVLVADEREIGRITGYTDDASFWGLLDGLLKSLPTAAGGSSVPPR